MIACASSPAIARRYSLALISAALIVVALLPLLSAQKRFPMLPTFSTPNALPLSFEPNRGQADSSVRFLVHRQGGLLYFTPSQVVLQIAGQPDSQPPSPNARPLGPDSYSQVNLTSVSLRFIGANPTPNIESGATLPGKVNYFLGKDRSAWHTGLPTYSTVTYDNLYPGISLTYSGAGGMLKGTYTIAPAADPSLIAWRYDNAAGITIDHDGNLQITPSNRHSTLRTPHLTELAPVAWQEINGTRLAVEVRYEVAHDRSVSFKLGTYNADYPLIIDPTLTYSTYLGGSAVEIAEGVAVDGSGNIYVAGITGSTNFPVSNPFQPNNAGGAELFVTKFDPTGSTLLYSTYLGGTGIDLANDIALDAQGNAYVTGRTSSLNFPLANPLQPIFGGSFDVFVTKLKPDGSDLVYSTYLGGNTWDEGFGLAVDAAGSAYLTGLTASPDFPTANPIQPNLNGGGDAFITKLSASGTQLVYSTYLGSSGSGAGPEAGNAIAVDANGQAYVTGMTNYIDFPVANAFQPRFGGGEGDAFITKLNTAGTALVYSTYLGGQDSLITDAGNGIAVDAAENVYVTGMTSSPNFPLAAPFQPTMRGNADVFVTKMSAAGTALVYSTFLGGTNDFQRLDEGTSIAVNAQGEAYIVGTTQAPDFPVVNPIQPNVAGSFDAFVSKFNAAGSALVYSTYLGGSSQDEGNDIAVSQGNAYAVGHSLSANFPTVKPFQLHNAGSADGFVARIFEPISHTPTPTSVPTNTPTATPTPALLTGHVTWQGALPQPHPSQQQSITVTLKMGATEINYPPQTTDPSGFFTVTLPNGLPQGTYNWRAKGPKSLANCGTVPLALARSNISTFQRANVSTISVEMGIMQTGDANDNNVVNTADFNILKLAFGGSSDLRADFNNDGVVNSTDFNLQKLNFGQSGCPLP